MGAGIKRPGEPGYDEWRERYRQQKNSLYLKTAIFLLPFVVIAIILFEKIQKVFHLNEWFGVYISYTITGIMALIVAGLFVYFKTISERRLEKSDKKSKGKEDNESNITIGGIIITALLVVLVSPLAIIFWPLAIFEMLDW